MARWLTALLVVATAAALVTLSFVAAHLASTSRQADCLTTAVYELADNDDRLAEGFALLAEKLDRVKGQLAAATNTADAACLDLAPEVAELRRVVEGYEHRLLRLEGQPAPQPATPTKTCSTRCPITP